MYTYMFDSYVFDSYTFCSYIPAITPLAPAAVAPATRGGGAPTAKYICSSN